MNLHGNAALSWSGRPRLAQRVVLQGWTLTAAAEAAGVSVRCAHKWVARSLEEGETGLLDRSRSVGRLIDRDLHARRAADLQQSVTREWPLAQAAGRGRP